MPYSVQCHDGHWGKNEESEIMDTLDARHRVLRYFYSYQGSSGGALWSVSCKQKQVASMIGSKGNVGTSEMHGLVPVITTMTS